MQISKLTLQHITLIKSSPFPVCGGLPVHLWNGWQRLSPKSYLWDARIPPPWLWPCWRAHQYLPHVRFKHIAINLIPMIIFSDNSSSLLSPSRSSYQSRMAEYINAEETGKQEGECFKFERDCSKSLFKTSKYSEEANRREKGTEMSRVTLERMVALHSPVDNEVM